MQTPRISNSSSTKNWCSLFVYLFICTLQIQFKITTQIQWGCQELRKFVQNLLIGIVR